MDDSLQALRKQGQDLWRAGGCGAAARSFGAAAMLGREVAITVTDPGSG